MNNPWSKNPIQVKFDFIKIWDWIAGKKRMTFKEYLAYKRKCYRQALHYKEPEITESESYDDIGKDG